MSIISIISRYKYREIEIENMWHLKTNTVPVMMESLCMTMKGADNCINLVAPAYMNYKLHFVELFIFKGEYYHYDWKKY